MKDVDLKLNRLLRAAARADVDLADEMPFGFDTRVLALARGGNGLTNSNGLARLIRRVALLAAAVIVVSSAAIVHEFAQANEFDEPMTNEFVIADSAIQNALQR